MPTAFKVTVLVAMVHGPGPLHHDMLGEFDSKPLHTCQRRRFVEIVLMDHILLLYVAEETRILLATLEAQLFDEYATEKIRIGNAGIAFAIFLSQPS